MVHFYPGILARLTTGAYMRRALVAANALLRHQRAILHRNVTRPRCTPADHVLLVLLTSRIRTWWQAVWIVQPDMLPRWNRDCCR